MKLFLVPNGNKFVVKDDKERTLYNIKKKGFGAGRFCLLDASGYELYSFVQTIQGKKPEFDIILNDKVFIKVRCLSVFLEPSIEFEHMGEKLKGEKYLLKSSDRKNFKLFRDDDEIGYVHTVSTMDGDLRYEIVIEDVYFDDYTPLFALAIEKAFGDMNKSK